MVHLLGIRNRLELRFLWLNPVLYSAPWFNHQRILRLNKLNNPLCPLLLKISTKKKSIKLGNYLHLALSSCESIWIWEPVAPCQWQMEAQRLPSHHPLPFMVSRDCLLSFVTQLQSSCCWGSCFSTLTAQLSWLSPWGLNFCSTSVSPELCEPRPALWGPISIAAFQAVAKQFGLEWSSKFSWQARSTHLHKQRKKMVGAVANS